MASKTSTVLQATTANAANATTTSASIDLSAKRAASIQATVALGTNNPAGARVIVRGIWRRKLGPVESLIQPIILHGTHQTLRNWREWYF
jgi:hypothetical protein